MIGELIRVRGMVQGVGFRPTVWRVANACGLRGEVLNDGEGVLIRAWGAAEAIECLCRDLIAQCPPLARIDALERSPLAGPPPEPGFSIVASRAGEVHTGVVPDAATCPACLTELLDPADRRFRYPFINCTHCGPRLTIVRGIPYDRANTSMAPFLMCPDCRREYEDPANRRFHAQPNACPACGPRVWLEDPEGRPLDPAALGAVDATDAASRSLAEGRILALKGIGGFHLACDAADARAVAELRRRKRRYAKPFALMARDLGVIRRYCRVREEEAALLASPAAPILLLEPADGELLAPGVAPGQSALGFMLPYSPLHHLLLADWDRPLVMTSGNLSDEPQCTDNREASERIGGLADLLLLHDRDIVNRVDDSVARFMDGAPRLLRRARGYAPASLSLPPGFADAPPVLALGGELKSTVCLLAGGEAVLSQHLGDLEEARTARAYTQTIELYLALFRQRPRVLAVDLHPGYRSTHTGRDWAVRDGLGLVEVQHHHAHIASVLAENGWPAGGPPVVGIALDGLGLGSDGTLWGGELLVAGYADLRRAGLLAPTPLPGGTKAILEPWRCAFAHLHTHLGWEAVLARYGAELRWLEERPLAVTRRMMERGINAPLTSSCGRLFDAVAAVLGIRRDGIDYEGQAAIELETLAARARGTQAGYSFEVRRALTPDPPLRPGEGEGLSRRPGGVESQWVLDPAPMWSALLDDLMAGREPAVMAARFHRGLADALADLTVCIAGEVGLDTAALSGGVVQNRILIEALAAGLRGAGLRVLTHHRVPANDGGLALGQAAVAAARSASHRSG